MWGVSVAFDAEAELDRVTAELVVLRWQWVPDRTQLDTALASLDGPQRVELLKAAVRRMPVLRMAPGGTGRRDGTAVYALAGRLYAKRLPLTEDDLCALLTGARHDCGHGVDTRAPFDLARDWQRRHGYSAAIGVAIRVFVANLPKATSIQLREVLRSAAILEVLEREPPARADDTVWAARLRHYLSGLSGAERRSWERIVLAMSASERMEVPRTWLAPAAEEVERLGGAQMLTRLREWWPDPRPDQVVRLERSGGQLLKHLIWLLDLLPPGGTDLVVRLVDASYRPIQHPIAVLKPSAAYLERTGSDPAALARVRARLAAAG